MYIFLIILFILLAIGAGKKGWDEAQANRAMIEMNKRQKRQEEQKRGDDQ